MDNTILLDAMRKARPALSRILRYRLDDIDDVLQNAAIKALTTKHPFRGHSKYATWFMRVAINEAFILLRLKQHDFVELSPRLYAKTQTPERYALRNEKRAQLVDAIKLLPRRKKQAALRMFLGDSRFTGAEKSYRHRMRATLKGVLRGA